MKIVFMGTPDFAIPSLRILLNSHHTIEAVVTTPDKERGRGQKLSFTPIKEFALENKLPVLQPENLKEEGFLENLKEINADLFVIVAFRILPPQIFKLPGKGSFNLHGSLLPKYRGAAPIQWAIINGEKETGVTTFFLEEKVDTGNIILQEKLVINDDDNFGTIHDKMSELGALVVLRTVNLIEEGRVKLLPQDNSSASPAPKVTRETARIIWERPAEEIHNLVRGLSPYPGAYFEWNSRHIKLFKSSISDKQLEPGEVYQTKTEAIIGCREKSLNLLELQPEGKKRMSTEEFLRGYSLL